MIKQRLQIKGIPVLLDIHQTPHITFPERYRAVALGLLLWNYLGF